MHLYEYKVVPAPKKGKRAKGVRGAEARFANALSDLMNEMAGEGWDYQRSDTLPCETRSGLTGRSTVFQNMLVFRRALAEAPTDALTPVADVAAVADETSVVVPVDKIAKAHAAALPDTHGSDTMPDHLPDLNGSAKKGRDLAAE